MRSKVNAYCVVTRHNYAVRAMELEGEQWEGTMKAIYALLCLRFTNRRAG